MLKRTFSDCSKLKWKFRKSRDYEKEKRYSKKNSYSIIMQKHLKYKKVNMKPPVTYHYIMIVRFLVLLRISSFRYID